MHREAARYFPLETGGLLMGYWSADDRGPVAVVTRLIGPGPKADRTPFSFEPDADWQAEQVARMYARSRRRITYLGDWHSHPGGAPRPSRRDLQVARLIAGAPEARASEPLLCILPLEEPGDVTLPSFYVLREGKLKICDADYR